MADLITYNDAWAMARALGHAALALVALDPVGALRLAWMASEVRAVRT